MSGTIRLGGVFLLLSGLAGHAQEPDAETRRVLAEAGVPRGVAVVIGDDALARSLAQHSEFRVYVQSPTEESAAELRRAAEKTGLLGQRLFIGSGPLARLHLADNLADVVVARGTSPAADEVRRVLRPGGKAWIGTTVVDKRLPTDTDDWSHPYHGPDNNPQSADRVARAPYLTHFLAEPWYSPMPLVTVAAGGRLFKAFGHVAIKEREWPLLNTLVCQNAFNGTVLWQRKLTPNFMIHRSTLIATPDTLFLADDTSLKLLDAATGTLKSEIVSSADDGRVWKWLALVDGTLFALVGPDETPDPTVRGERRARGWPWGQPLGRGYNSQDYPWGFGRTILALDPATKQVKWRHRETEPIDTRAMCLAAGRLFYYCHGKFLAALDTGSGQELWRSADAELLAALGERRFAQNPTEGFSSSTFVKGNDRAIYFAGPTRIDLVAVSASDGKLLWRKEKGGNSQLVLRSDGLYAMSPGQSAKYDYLTGQVLQDLGPRVNCTRATGSFDSIFVRGGRDGTMRYDLTTNAQQHLCPMRPSCQDGVLISHGHLFWGPWMCDCNLTLVGVVSLAPAGAFDFAGRVEANERLEKGGRSVASKDFAAAPQDWPTLRANNERTAHVDIALPELAKARWTWTAPSGLPLTAPTVAGGRVFFGGRDGVVRALDAARGSESWSVPTGGAIAFPPTIAAGRAYVGSADGWVYCLDAATGARLWRFRAAPAERWIPVYGGLSSTWPVNSGVLVDDGVAYFAAGIANHDGTHVFALDAVTGEVRWHNHTSGSLRPETSAGVSVNGHLLLHGGRLHLAGGNMVPVASYDLKDGRCVTDPEAPKSHTQFKAGGDLFVVGDQVQAGGAPLFSPRGDYRMVNQSVLQTPRGNVVLAYGPHDSRVARFEPAPPNAPPAPEATPEGTMRWLAKPLHRVSGIAVGANALVLAGGTDVPLTDAQAGRLVALNVQDGTVRWQHALPSPPVPWGVALDRTGRTIVTLQNGQVLGFE